MLNKINRHFIVFGLLLWTLLSLSAVDVYSAEEEPVEPSLKEQKAKEGYIVNLQDLIKKSKKKMEKVNDKLQDQARYRRNQQREEKAREY